MNERFGGTIMPMFVKRVSLLFVTLMVLGCGKHDAPAPAPVATAPAPTGDPDQRLYEELRSGQYQLSAAQDNLTTASDLAKTLSKMAGGTAEKGFTDLLAKLNTAGQKLGDFTDEVPPFEEFKKDSAQEDDRRLNAIQAGNDALGDLADAQDIVENLLAGAPAEAKPDVQKVQDQLDEAVDAVEAGITAMGGKVEDDDPIVPGTPGPSAGG